MIRSIIVEDSRLARLELKEMLKSHPKITITGEGASAAQGLELIRLLEPELIFLDIHMPGKSGFDMLAELDRVPAVIFTTAFDEYALQAFDYNTIDYLLKPILPERLQIAIHKATAHLTDKQLNPGLEKLSELDRIFVKDAGKCWFVTIADIRLFESKGNYTQLHFGGNSPMILKPLQQINESLDPAQYLRVNRAQIVNVKFIAGVKEAFNGCLKLTLTTGEAVEVSRRQAGKFKELFTF